MGKNRSLISMDWALKRLLRNKANYEVLEGFLTVLLGFDIHISNIAESEGNQENELDKFNRVDISAKTTDNEIIIVELQVTYEADYLHRILYATSKAITEHLDIGGKYGEIVKVYSVNIVYFELGQGNDYVYHGKTEFRGLHSGDILALSERQKKTLKQIEISEIYPEYYILKVNGFDKIAKNSLDEWMYYFKTNEIPENFYAKGLQKAREVLKTDNMTNEEYSAYKRHLENLRYANSMIDTAKTEGLVEGRAEGRVEERIELAKKAKSMGMSIADIAKLTGLSESEIELL